MLHPNTQKEEADLVMKQFVFCFSFCGYLLSPFFFLTSLSELEYRNALLNLRNCAKNIYVQPNFVVGVADHQDRAKGMSYPSGKAVRGFSHILAQIIPEQTQNKKWYFETDKGPYLQENIKYDCVCFCFNE